MEGQYVRDVGDIVVDSPGHRHQTESSSREEGLILAHGLRGQSASRRWHGGTGCGTMWLGLLAYGEIRNKPGDAVLGSSPWVGVATLKVGLLSSVQPLWERPHRHLRCVSQGIPSPQEDETAKPYRK